MKLRKSVVESYAWIQKNFPEGGDMLEILYKHLEHWGYCATGELLLTLPLADDLVSIPDDVRDGNLIVLGSVAHDGDNAQYRIRDRSLMISDALEIQGNIFVRGNLNVTGKLTCESIWVGGNLEAYSIITRGSAFINGRVEITGDAEFLNWLVFGEIDVQGRLSVSGGIISNI